MSEFEEAVHPDFTLVLANWRQHTPQEICSAVVRGSKEGGLDLVPMLTELLDHRDAVVREEAVSALLLGFTQHHLYDRALGFLDDPEMDAAPRVLARYVETEAPDRYSQLMELLVAKLIDASDASRQIDLYQGVVVLLRIGEKLRMEYSPPDFRLDRDVDWSRVAEWAPDGFEVPQEFLARRDVSTEHDLEAIRNGTLPAGERIAAMRRLLADHRHEARSAIQQLCRDDDPTVQVAALRDYFGAWGTIRAASAASCLASPSEAVQAAAADTLSAYGRRLGHFPSIATAHLEKALQAGISPAAKRKAYLALLEIIDGDKPVSPPEPFDPETDIDWEYLRLHLPRGS